MREVELPSEKVRADDSDSESERRRRPRMRRSRRTRALKYSKVPLGGKVLPNRPVKSDQRLTSSEKRWCISKVKIRALEQLGEVSSRVRIGIKKRVLLKKNADIVNRFFYGSSRRIVLFSRRFFLGKNHDIGTNQGVNWKSKLGTLRNEEKRWRLCEEEKQRERSIFCCSSSSLGEWVTVHVLEKKWVPPSANFCFYSDFLIPWMMIIN